VYVYGTVYRFRPLPGKEEDVLDYHRRWKAERWPRVSGFVTEYIYRSASKPGEYVGAAVFESKEAMERNGRDPEEDRWYRQFRSLLEADPEWEDGEIIFVY
jgi:quinol monooxygenase YgiN